jgi:uncharacterized membrane protein YdbT with pleckstrin-like domain
MGKPHYNKELRDSDKKRHSKFLAEEEELEIVTGYSSIYLRQKFIIQIIFPGIIFILAGCGLAFYLRINLAYGIIGGLVGALLLSAILTWIINQSHRYLLTTRRVIIKEGFIKIKVASALYDKITHIEVDQGLTDRLFLHHGTIILNTAGGNQDSLILKYVEQPVEFKNILERLIHEERGFFNRRPSTIAVEGELVDDF